MRIVITLNDYDPNDGEIIHDQHCVKNPTEAADERAVVDGYDTEWYPGGGNIHVLDESVEQVADLMDGSVLIDNGNHDDQVLIPNADLSAVYTDAHDDDND